VFLDELAGREMADNERKEQEKDRRLIPSYGEYVNKYVLQAAVRGKGAVPGEHHFVALYLVPRLTGFSFLGVPHFVNPDGMKASAGDVVFCSYVPEKNICYVPTTRLKIEVKLENPREGSIELTRLQYYHWIRQERRPEDRGKPNLSAQPEQPDLFVGVSEHGVVVLPWAVFRDTFIKEVYPKGLIDIQAIKGRPSPTGKFPMSCFDWAKDGSSPYYFRYSKKMEEWPELEASFLESLKHQCSELTSGTPIQPLQPRPDV
jgi:hypothetical protein